MELPGDDGALVHAELRLGMSVLMLGPEVPNSDWPDLRQMVDVKVADLDAHFAQAKAAGATIVRAHRRPHPMARASTPSAIPKDFVVGEQLHAGDAISVAALTCFASRGLHPANVREGKIGG